MKVKCDFCGSLIDEGLASCPNCGGSMPTANRVAPEQPRTIEELKQWYTAHNLPPENVTRFFIGKDIKEPRAFGIYQNDHGDFVVYKNKANGERAIRYQGVDEGYAVNELYQRLRAEIANQKTASNTNVSRTSVNTGKKKKRWTIWDILLLPLLLPLVSPLFSSIFLIAIVGLFSLFDHSPQKGYYNYNGNDYYYQGSNWYSYDASSDSWDYLYDDDFLDSVITDDTYSDYATYDHEGSRFEDSSWYDSGSYSSSYDWDDDDDDWSSSSWDSDYSWDSSSSWDYGGSDWDSDW